MSSWVDTLLRQGYLPPGAKENTIAPVIDTAAEALTGYNEDQDKMLKDQFDMYKTLRESGYEPQRAHEAVMKRRFPQEAGGTTIKEEKADADIKKTKALTDVYNAKAAAIPKNSATYEKTQPQKRNHKTKVWINEGEPEYLPMINPEGAVKKVLNDDVQRALKKGWTVLP